jgi:hypothetical protein
VLLNKKGFYKKVCPMIVPNMEKRGMDKPSDGSKCYINVLSKS